MKSERICYLGYPWHLRRCCDDGDYHHPVFETDPSQEHQHPAALTVQGVILCLLNAVIVALAAGGTYDAATTGMVKHTDAAILDAEGKGEA